MARKKPTLKIKVQVYCGDEIAMGPGKAQLLDAIGEHGSISAGARAIGMSYRRAWMLVDVMNRCWTKPLVETAPGGRARAGARVTAFGAEVLARYRGLQARADAVQDGKDWDRLDAAVRRKPKAAKQAS